MQRRTKKGILYVSLLASGIATTNLYLSKRRVRGCNRGNGPDVGRRCVHCDGSKDPIHQGQCRQVVGRTGRHDLGGSLFVLRVAVVLSALVLRVLVGQWWNPVTLWDDIVGGATDAWGTIKSWIYWAIRHAVDAIDDSINFVKEAYDLALSLVWGAINTVWGWAATAVNWVDNAWNTVSGWIWDAVVGFYRDVILPAIRLVDEAWQYAWNALDYVVHAIENTATYVFDHFIAPAFDWIVHAAETVGRWIGDAVGAFYHDFILPIIDSVTKAWEWIVKADAFLFHVLYDVWTVLVKAWDWIVWFALHSFDDIFHTLERGPDFLNHAWLTQTAESSDEWANRLVDDLEKILR